jgi:hypothetical protein
MMNYESGIRKDGKRIAEQLSQILTAFVTNRCRKTLPYLRHMLVTNTCLFCYGTTLNLSQIFTKFATKKTDINCAKH